MNELLCTLIYVSLIVGHVQGPEPPLSHARHLAQTASSWAGGQAEATAVAYYNNNDESVQTTNGPAQQVPCTGSAATSQVSNVSCVGLSPVYQPLLPRIARPPREPVVRTPRPPREPVVRTPRPPREPEARPIRPARQPRGQDNETLPNEVQVSSIASEIVFAAKTDQVERIEYIEPSPQNTLEDWDFNKLYVTVLKDNYQSSQQFREKYPGGDIVVSRGKKAQDDLRRKLVQYLQQYRAFVASVLVRRRGRG